MWWEEKTQHRRRAPSIHSHTLTHTHTHSLMVLLCHFTPLLLLPALRAVQAKRPGAEDWADSADRQLLSMAGALRVDDEAREDVREMRREAQGKQA